jgi:hypothetical protein
MDIMLAEIERPADHPEIFLPAVQKSCWPGADAEIRRCEIKPMPIAMQQKVRNPIQ